MHSNSTSGQTRPRPSHSSLLRADIQRIIGRHFLSTVTLVMGSVILLLLWFGEGRDALFLSSVIVINIIVGLYQEIRARLTLEKLRTRLANKLRRVNQDGSKTTVMIDEINVGDLVELRRGDVIAMDGPIISSNGLEVSEAFLTGESASLRKHKNDRVLAGSWVTAGTAIVIVKAIGEETRNGGQTQLLRHYKLHLTPIERGLATLISGLTYVLLIASVSLVARQTYSLTSGQHPTQLITQIAALTATLVPEGLVLATTVLFAYTALKLLRRNLVLQRLSAAEALARVQVLCIDKTGTLTEAKLTFSHLTPALGVSQKLLKSAFASYLVTSEPDGELAAVAPFLVQGKVGTTLEAFSSSRGYGTITYGNTMVRVGIPEKLLIDLSRSEQKWLEEQLVIETATGARILAVTHTKAGHKPTLLGLAVYGQPLKKSALPALSFFSNRAVAIKIISGDHPSTLRTIAQDLELELISERVITGNQLEGLTKTELAKLIKRHSLFARISPEQKALLINAAKTNGCVGMIGDGTNDALAVKAADLGISMLAASEVTRTLADIVLTNNHFSELSRGVRLADSVITTIELIACLFLNKVVVGLTLVAASLIANTPFPLSPRNITVLNYFIIGIPILLWTYYPRTRDRSPHEAGFLRRILPFVLLNGLIAGSITLLGFYLASKINIDVQMTIFLTTLALGMGMLIIAPMALGVKNTHHYLSRVFSAGLVSALVILVVFKITVLRDFFGLDQLSFGWLGLGLVLSGFGFGLQLLILRPGNLSRVAYLFRLHQVT